MQIETDEVDGALVVRPCEDRLDAAAALAFKDSIRDLTDEAPERVVLDMRQITFLDSSGLGAVVGTMKTLAPERRLELANLNTAVRKVFKLTRMEDVFVIHDNFPGAAAHAG